MCRVRPMARRNAAAKSVRANFVQGDVTRLRDVVQGAFDLVLDFGCFHTLPPDQRHAIAAKLHAYTGLPVDYIEKSDLRVNAGQFNKTLFADTDQTTGRLDTRFSGPTLDPLSREAEYDPQSAAIGSAYVSAFNDYVRKDLKFGENREYKPEIDVEKGWNFLHQPPAVAAIRSQP